MRHDAGAWRPKRTGEYGEGARYRQRGCSGGRMPPYLRIGVLRIRRAPARILRGPAGR